MSCPRIAIQETLDGGPSDAEATCDLDRAAAGAPAGRRSGIKPAGLYAALKWAFRTSAWGQELPVGPFQFSN